MKFFKNKKKYQLTKETQYLEIKFTAYDYLSERYIKENNHKMAVECRIQSENLKIKFWKQVYELYPKLEHIPLAYDRVNNYVYIKES